MTVLSLIMPVYNEAVAIQPFLFRIDQLRAGIGSVLGDDFSLELLFINDGSQDETQVIVEGLAVESSEVKLINLSRNFGKEAALSAGLNYTSGDVVIPIDVDMQDPPEVIIDMLKKWKAGAQVVNAKRVDRTSDSFLKRGSASAFYAILDRVADQPVHPHVGDFRLFDRKAVMALNQLPENTRYNKGLFSWIGFKVEEVDLVRTSREVGSSKWKPTKLWELALDGITSSTTLPLRIWTYLGAAVALFAIVYAFFLIGYTLITGGDTPGFASIMVAVLFLGGLNLLSLGLLGEYIGRIAREVRRRPNYIIESTKGF
ncbi:glycosyltransferase family 2 protein [Altererythrobacter sp.]|uniref:glycosyltransferase family 2 protein n=1 Tax=Altererythrobacter sp. TaxID=1872480 RepID=UPI001B21E94C|nr:glycosyltransferase family 2 protein [Altererythrobacter sp.]MBO6609669.1 glycosyltransferase family 2 protein [Altererythrobacter sp.]MBO6641181.1 glycosyltransferase family 2 protein [Altererythrobacter sp.]MBO6708121.1 glycosyltransferase family 2 protein [Altererythrobacter sp.]MBO6945745.1 glycosyltransferase family 2 protein [Altererythrobacter sp.]